VRQRVRDEAGQAVVETALILMALLLVTVGLVDVGRGMFSYNEVSAIARYASRWGSVVGGTCGFSKTGGSTSDWCNQLSNATGNFWSQSGNDPIQGAGVDCPAYSSGGSNPDYYTVGSYSSSSTSTIIGAIARHFDSTSSSSNVVVGLFSPGMDLSKLHVCIASSGSGYWPPEPGDSVSVRVYYPFQPAGSLFGNPTLPLSVQSDWQVE